MTVQLVTMPQLIMYGLELQIQMMEIAFEEKSPILVLFCSSREKTSLKIQVE